MMRNLYGKRMFIADLLIVSLWALFAWHEAGCGFVMSVMIIMRMALSFELYRKSCWASMSALMFALIYAGCVFAMPFRVYVEEPVNKMIYVGLCLLGQSDVAIVSIHCGILWAIGGMISGWLVLVPLIGSVGLKSCAGVLINQRRLWWYLAFVISATVLFLIEVKDMTVFMFAFLMSLTPLVYRMLYCGGKRPLIQLVVCDKILMSYFIIIAVFYSAVMIGLYNLGASKTLAAFLLPIILYVISSRLTDSMPKTIPAMMFGIGGLFFVNCYNRVHEIVIVLLCVGVGLTLLGTILTVRYSRNISTSVLLFIANGIALPVILLGYNPIAVINADYVDLMKDYYSKAPNGLYEFSEEGYIGVRDRYGVIIPPEYSNIYFLEDTSEYIVLAIRESNSSDFHLQVFDLCTKDFVIPEDGYKVTKIEQIDYHKYAMFDNDGEQVYTLTLSPGSDYSEKYKINFAHRTMSPHLVRCKLPEYNDPHITFSADLKEAEKELIEIYNRKEYCDRELMDLLQSRPETINYPFSRLQTEAGITITTSQDNKIRLYAWDTHVSCTSPEYQTYVQYVTGDTVITRTLYVNYFTKYVFADDIRKDGHEIGDGSFCDAIYQIPMNDRANAYIIFAYNQATSVDGTQKSILVYEKDGRLEKLPFIDEDGDTRYVMEVDYNIPDCSLTTNQHWRDWIMSFDSKTHTLYVPAAEDNQRSDRYELYRYTDGKMKYIGKGAGTGSIHREVGVRR